MIRAPYLLISCDADDCGTPPLRVELVDIDQTLESLQYITRRNAGQAGWGIYHNSHQCPSCERAARQAMPW